MTSVINWLDSIGFFIGNRYFSVFLILKSLFFLILLLFFFRFIKRKINAFIVKQERLDPDIRDLLTNLVQVALYTTLTLIMLDLIGLDLTSLAIFSGAIGIGIGLGLQRIAANFISGLLIVLEQNVKVGHLVEMAGWHSPGWIRHLGARAAVIDTEDGKELLVPNEELLTKTLIDWTFQDKKIRTNLQVQVTFSSNLERAREIILEVLLKHPLCSKHPLPSCFLEKFTESGALFSFNFWMDEISIKRLKVREEILLAIWKQFSEEKIKFATS